MAFYVISVRQTGDLPVVSLFPHPASFRFHLAMDTLTFGYILPTTGRIRDLHPLETCAAGRTFNTMKGTCEQIPFHFFLKFMMLSSTGGLVLALKRAFLLLAQKGGIANTFTGPL